MTERRRPGVRGVEENPQSYLGGTILYAIALALVGVGAFERNWAMIGAGALIYGGYEGTRWFINRRRNRPQ